MEDTDIKKFLENTLQNCFLQSQVPSATLQQECCMGIDEAGRGPVLGPMVYGASFCPLSMLQEVKELGVADSKVLSEEKRDELFKVISLRKELLGWKVEIISPNYISNAMLQRTKHNLNAISHQSAIGLIRHVLDEGVNLKEVYVDTVGSPDKYQSMLQRLFPQLTIIVTKKADALFPIVSAASICAKVIRDACLKNWQFVENYSSIQTQFGSGYPGDPNTKAWMEHNLDVVFGYPTVVRFSWDTCRRLLESKAVDIQWPDDDDTEASIGCAKISSYFSVSSQAVKRHRFFEERSLRNVIEF